MRNINEYIIEKLHLDKDSEFEKVEPFAADRFNVGDIIVGVYTYNSRHVTFYEVINVKGKTITVKELKDKVVKGGMQNGEVEPKLGEYTGKEFSGRINKYGNLKIDGDLCHLWSGDPESVYSD